MNTGKILRLEAEAFKRLKVVEITPEGNVVQIRGQNGQGKTSVLDAIAAAIGGEKLCPTVPIHIGEEKAHVTVELGDLTVTRRWTAKDSYLTVEAKDGSVFRSGQKILDTLIGPLSFDPLAFCRMGDSSDGRKKQLKLVQEVVGLDLEELQKERKQAYDDRTLVNREAERAAAQVPEPVVGDVPDAEESMDALLLKIDEAAKVKAANDAKRAELTKLRADHAAKTEAIKQAKASLAKAEKELEDLTATGKTLGAQVKALKDPDAGALSARVRELEGTNAKVRQKKARETLKAAAEAKRSEAEQLTQKIAKLDKERADRIAAAKFPVEGLGFGEAGLTLNGLPFEQASGAEQLRVSLAMGLALNPKLRVILIRDGSLLDEKSLALVAEMAAKADAQVWIEMVGDGPVGVVIEDGMVSGASEEKPKRSRKTADKPEETKPAPVETKPASSETPKAEPKPEEPGDRDADEKPEPDAGEQDCPF